MMAEVLFPQELGARTPPNGAGPKGRLRDAKPAVVGFCLDLRPVFQWPLSEAAGAERDNRRRSSGTGPRRKPFLGGSDPTLSGFSAAQRLRRRGSLPPKLFSKVPRS